MPKIKMCASDLKNIVPEIKTMLVTASPKKELSGTVDIWCIPWHEYDFKSKDVRKRKAKGEEFWTYSADYVFNDAYHPMNLRVNYWLYYDSGIQGLHYAHHMPKAFLNYPNDTYLHSDGFKPIPSLRWEMMRQGTQDFEYLKILSGKLQKFSEYQKQYAHLLKIPPYLATSKTSYSLNPAKWNKRKQEIAQAIVNISACTDYSVTP